MKGDATPTAQPSGPPRFRSIGGAVRAPRALHRLFVVGGPALVGAAFLAGIVRPNSPLLWLLLGAGAAVFLVSRKVVPAGGACAFCGTPRENVSFLVADSSVAICPNCVASAAAKTAGEFDRRGRGAEWVRMYFGGLPDRSPLELSRPYVALVVGEDRTPASIRNALSVCFRFGHYRLAQELLETIPELERTPDDWVNLGVAHSEQGQYADALKATRRPQLGSPHDPWILANVAWYELRLHPQAPRQDLLRWRDQAIEARRLLTDRPPARYEGTEQWHHTLAAFHGTEAEACRLLGDTDGALRALKDAEAHEPHTGERLLLRASVLRDLGRVGESRADAEAAVKLLRAGSPACDDARRFLDALPCVS